MPDLRGSRPAARAAQWLSRASLDVEERTLPGRAAAALLRQLRRALVAAAADPPVRYPLGGARLALPLSHALPLHRKAFPDYSENLARVARRLAERYPDLAMIDVGANVGDSVLLVRAAVACPILCVEGNARFLPYLHENVAGLPDVSVAECFLGAEPGEGERSVVTRSGTAQLRGGGEAQPVSVRTLAQLVEAHPRFSRAKLVKVDTDGMDVDIVAGGLEWISRARPVLFVEYDPDLTRACGGDAAALFDRLRGAGYTRALAFEHTGDFLVSLDLDDRRILEDLHHFYLGRGGERYCDLCLFHGEDEELFRRLRADELARHAARDAGRAGKGEAT